MADLIGQRLGNYRLLRLIGRGGFADVYLAEHVHLGTQAAIKVLQVRLVESNRENFLNEARTIAHLVHPYIIRVLDFGVEHEIPFLVMDYAPRGTFRQRYLRGKPLPAAPLVSFMKQTAAALQYGHDKKLIHRDVKPENMLLGPNDEILLSDFGFALIAHNSSSSMPTETAGTAAYMAPEQLQGKPRPASDQYALGVIAYEWLSGSGPFHGSFFELASQQVFSPPPPLREKVPGIAPEIVQVVMTALAKDPQARFPTVRDFALALEEACLSSRQYAFNLPIAQQASPILRNTSGVAFPTGNQHSGSHSHSDTRYPHPSGTSAQDAYKRFSIDPSQPSHQSAQSGVWQHRQAEPAAAPGASHTSLDRIRSFPGTTAVARNLSSAPDERANPRLPRLPAGTTSGSRQAASFPDASSQHVISDPLAQPQTVPVHVPGWPQAKNVKLGEPALREAQLSASRVPQARHQPEVEPHGTAATRTHTDEPVTRTARAKPASTSSQDLQQKGQPQDPPVRAAHVRPARDKSSRSNTFLFVSLFILLIMGIGGGVYSYVMHTTHTTHTAPSGASAGLQQPKSEAKPTSMALINPAPTPLPTVDASNPYPPHSGTFVLNEPLTSNNYGWQESTATATGGACQFIKDGYQDTDPIIDPNPCFAYNTNFADFTYQVDMKFTVMGQSHSGAGIIFRGNSTTGKYYYFEIYDTGKYSLQLCNAGNCNVQLAGSKPDDQGLNAFHRGLNVSNTLAVVAAGPKFDLYVNHQLIKEVVDPNNTYTVGMIGMLTTGGNDKDLHTAATSTPGQATFSNAKVWKL